MNKSLIGSDSKFIYILLIVFILLGQGKVAAQEGSCHFNKSTLKFAGDTDLAEAKCLLRHVRPGGELDPQLEHLPEPLESLIGKDVAISREALLRYLSAQAIPIPESKIGGKLSQPLSRARNNNPGAPVARYFVIHDTSTPNLCEAGQFPENINSATWKWRGTSWNSIHTWENSKDAHLYITRDGESVAPQGRTFSNAWRATKLEGPNQDTRAKGLFLHIENIQPRRCKPNMSQPAGLVPDRRYYKLNQKGEWECRNDHFAPDPGLSDAQLDRLALAYVSASVRRGTWLIPAFHAAVDFGISDGHDDPQYFELDRWADRLRALMLALQP